jgi:hypothetical protein
MVEAAPASHEGGTEHDAPDSQETTIHDMINLDYDTHNMAKHHKILSIKLDSFLESKDD